MGGLRSAAQMVSYEVPHRFFGGLGPADGRHPQSLVGHRRGPARCQLCGSSSPASSPSVSIFICGVAETNRNPFDLPEAEAELVAGFHTEYSGMKFAIFYMAEYINMMVVSSLAVIFFFGGWLRPFPKLSRLLAFLDLIPPFFWFYGKVLGFIFVYIWFRGTFPRYRFDQLMQVGWKWLLAALAGQRRAGGGWASCSAAEGMSP